ncbi:hypothetical protein [Thermococcus sp.]
MTAEQNLDRMAAEIGFKMCDIVQAIYQVTKEKIEKSDNVEMLNQQSLTVEDILSMLRLKKEDKEIVKQILKIVNPLESIKNKRNLDEKLEELRKAPPKFDAKEYYKVTTKALGILIEDGPFAYSIWLESEGKEPHRIIELISLELLKRTNLVSESNKKLRESILEEISTSLEKTLLARQLLERMLIYARYRAKALQKEGEAG